VSHLQISVASASPFPGDQARTATINVGPTLPPEVPMLNVFRKAEYEAFFQREAQSIEETLHDSLPGGTYDRLMGEMLKRKASVYRVGYTDHMEAAYKREEQLAARIKELERQIELDRFDAKCEAEEMEANQ